MDDNGTHEYKGYTIATLPFETMGGKHSARFSIHEGGGISAQTRILPVMHQGAADMEFDTKHEAAAHIRTITHEWIDAQTK